MTFIRNPSKRIPNDVKEYWESIQLKDDDPRLGDDRFQKGHMIAISWATVARWMNMRAIRDAKTLKTPLFIVQSADISTPRMPLEDAKKFMNAVNPGHTGKMHGILPIHLGMRVRLLDALDHKKTLVKDA